MEQNLAVARLPLPERLDKATVGYDFTQRMKNSSSTARRVPTLSLLLVPGNDATFLTSARGDAARDCGVVTLAIEQFRLRENRPPSKLSDLVPDFIAKVPSDPFDGRPLRYKMDSSQYIVYSVGLNREDDGGSLSQAADEGLAVSFSEQ